MQHWLLQSFTNTDLCSNVMFILCGLWMSRFFPHDALRVIGLSRVIACGALYLESRELIIIFTKICFQNENKLYMLFYYVTFQHRLSKCVIAWTAYHAEVGYICIRNMLKSKISKGNIARIISVNTQIKSLSYTIWNGSCYIYYTYNICILLLYIILYIIIHTQFFNFFEWEFVLATRKLGLYMKLETSPSISLPWYAMDFLNKFFMFSSISIWSIF